ncbi:MAG: arylsulfatase [Bryobacterales bacterium]|nr:arylsulfatase [Bryobacterales bacterium]
MIPKSYDRMSRRGLLLSMAGLNPWLPLRGHATPAGAPRPNIVVLLSDDMGWEQVGLNGGKEVRTPNIDRIAREGLKMSQFYVQPVCTPSRSCLLTGRYAWKTGTERRPTGSARQGMLRDERTVAEALREAGYATWMVGKWHLGEWQAGHLPRARGFDHHYGHYGALIDSYTHTRGGVLDWHRNGKPVVEEGYSTFPLAKEASSLIARHDGKRPFFLYLPFNAVHGPHMAPPDYLKKYEHLGGGRGAQCRGAQRAQMECLDVAVGRVLQAIRDKGVDRQTLVVFLNDNGGPRVVGANGPYRGFKSHYHEGGIRVPAAARWPGQIPAGGSTDEMLHAIDLFPTLCRLAGAGIGKGLPLDGRDAWPTMTSRASSPRSEIVHSLQVMRAGDWKFIEQGASYYEWTGQPLQLYNIREDPYEKQNLAAERPEIVSRLRERLAYYRQFAREGEPEERIPDYPPVVYGEEENREYGESLREKIKALGANEEAESPRARQQRKK